MNRSPSAHPRALLRFGLTSLLVVACASGGGAVWTYAPLGPTQSPGGTAAPTDGATGAPSPDGTGAQSPAASGVAIDVVTPQSAPLAFEPNVLEMPAATAVTVNYLNDSNLPHNIEFFDGPDASAQLLGGTEIVTGPGALESVTFTTPDEPGDYFFWCRVHGNAMVGTYRVTE